LRPSSPARHHLQTVEAGQLTLPFLVEAEVLGSAASNRRSDGAPPSCPRSSTGKAASPQHSNGKELSQPVGKERREKRKPPMRSGVPLEEKLLVSRKVAAEMLTISIRKVDYMIADGRLLTRRIDSRVLIPIEEIRKLARSDQPRRMAG
jgi:hypothetical protein